MVEVWKDREDDGGKGEGKAKILGGSQIAGM